MNNLNSCDNIKNINEKACKLADPADGYCSYSKTSGCAATTSVNSANCEAMFSKKQCLT